MADATVTLGLDAAPMRAGLQKASAEVNAFSAKAQRAIVSGGGGGARGGMLAMQLQDIAVQAQMGTSALTIFSQQAPQVLSAFGNLGALAGGFAAVGGAAFTFGQKSSEAFRTALNEAIALNAEIGKLAGSGAGLESSLDSFQRITNAQKALMAQSQSRQDGGGIGQMSQELLSLFGLAESNYDQSKEAELATVVLKKQQARLQNEIVKASANEVKLAELKASGDDKAVEALERKLKLEAQIQKIKSFGLDAGPESKLIENAKAISDLQGQQKAKTFDVAKNIKDQADFANQLLAPYQQFLNFLDQQKQKQDQINAANKQANTDLQKKNELAKNSAQTIEEELRMLAIKSTGNEKAIKAAEREAAINANSRRVQKELGIDSSKARAIAEQMQMYQDRIDGGVSGRIQGFSRARAGLPAFTGLAGMAALDRDVGSRLMKPSDFGTPFKGMQGGREPMTPVTRAIQQLEETIKAIMAVD